MKKNNRLKKRYMQEYMKKLIDDAKYFYKTQLPSLYDESLDIKIDFRDNSDFEVARKSSKENEILYHVTEDIPEVEDLGSTTIDYEGIEIPRKIKDMFILIHEMGHGYYYNKMYKNPSFKILSELMEKAKTDTQLENDLFNKIGAKSSLRNYPEMFAVSMEKLWAETMKQDPNVSDQEKAQIEEFREKSIQTRKNNVIHDRYGEQSPHISQKTNSDGEEKDEFQYEHEFFYRMYHLIPESEIADHIQDCDVIKMIEIQRQENGEYTDEYRNFLDNPELYITATKMGEQRKNQSLDEIVCEIMNSDIAKKQEIDSKKYEVGSNSIFRRSLEKYITKGPSKEDLSVKSGED